MSCKEANPRLLFPLNRPIIKERIELTPALSRMSARWLLLQQRGVGANPILHNLLQLQTFSYGLCVINRVAVLFK